MKKLGVEHIIAVSAVGSMKEEIKPLDIVIPDQFLTGHEAESAPSLEDGIVGHVSLPIRYVKHLPLPCLMRQNR